VPTEFSGQIRITLSSSKRYLQTSNPTCETSYCQVIKEKDSGFGIFSSTKGRDLGLAPKKKQHRLHRYLALQEALLTLLCDGNISNDVTSLEDPATDLLSRH